MSCEEVKQKRKLLTQQTGKATVVVQKGKDDTFSESRGLPCVSRIVTLVRSAPILCSPL